MLLLTDSEGVTDRTHSCGTHFFFFLGGGGVIEGGQRDGEEKRGGGCGGAVGDRRVGRIDTLLIIMASL